MMRKRVKVRKLEKIAEQEQQQQDFKDAEARAA